MATDGDAAADAVKTLRCYAGDVFDGPASTSGPPPTKEELKGLAERVKTDASKVALMWSGGQPSVQEASGVVGALLQSSLGLISKWHGLTYGCGPSLKEDLRKAVLPLAQALEDLLEAVANRQASELTKLVGHVWGACDALLAAPLDNKSCLFRRFAASLASVQDVAREADEMLAEPSHKATNGTAPGAEGNGNGEGSEGSAADDDDDDDDDDVVDFKSEPLGPGERRAAVAARELVAVSGAVLKAISRRLLQGGALSSIQDPASAAAELAPLGSTGPQELLEGWESCQFHVKALQRCTEDLGAALYPPQDAEEVGDCGEAIFNTLELLLDEVPTPAVQAAPGPAAAADEVEALRGRLEAAAGALREALRPAGEGA